MRKYFENLARALLSLNFSDLSDIEKRVIKRIANREPIAENVNELIVEESTFGQRLADRVAAFGGSWTFILLFTAILCSWMYLNSWLLTGTPEAWDPYPYILLNLLLSSIAALQAPIIMMAQNRMSQKDRIKADATFEVNLKMDLEIMRLNQKLDSLMEHLHAKNEELSDYQ